MPDMGEFYDGENVIITVSFTDKTQTPPAPTDPSAASLDIQPGYDPADFFSVPLGSLSKVSTGVYTYKYQTRGLTASSNAPVDVVAQADAPSDPLVAVSDKYWFRVLPRLSGLA